MSLMLRKQCQEHLNAIGLTSFHVSINDNKNLTIVTKCGKPFVTVYGISFNRSSPTNAEIEYASELFEQFLTQHKKALDNYINEYDSFHSLPVIEQRVDEFYVNEYGLSVPWDVKYMDGPMEIRVIKSGKIIRFHKNKDSVDLIDATNYRFNTLLHTAAVLHLVNYITYRGKKDKLNDTENALSVCDI